MKTLGKFKNGNRVTTYSQHWDSYGNKAITVHQSEDVEPVFKRAKILKETTMPRGELKFKASIPLNVMEEASKLAAAHWGVKKHEAYREITQSKTDRAQGVLRTLTEGRDFRKLQGA
ncbi:hypothetical protein GWO43_16005 [candidate division KSB1 bacterium]|nr:hypothetical protein [candidate division KSB1 bacterium]NIV68736.1 hypothetical protein [Phycisphaerae bacterium]NIS25455.1 hypothetical protein [candidate division KSB1 bacterium]NIT72347.1 hypothetical protein [candidate division KSB1 bacterium]NIU26132.1 hypothetical protein [candidate division KSB1 bacterium]